MWRLKWAFLVSDGPVVSQMGLRCLKWAYRVCLGLFFKAMENGQIEYIHVGSDSQKMNFAQKWINIFIRYTIDGLPVTTTLGVQRVCGVSDGPVVSQMGLWCLRWACRVSGGPVMSQVGLWCLRWAC